MFYHAKNGCLKIDDTTMDYLSFGKGTKNVIMIPGLGDGLKTAKGMAIPFAILYRMFAKDYKVYVFSRKNMIAPGYSTQDMAADINHAMELLGIDKAHVIGVSQGGMIAQHLAADFPDRVDKLVLVVTLSRPNACLEDVISSWIALAEEGNYRTLMVDTAMKMYTPKYLSKNKWMLAFAGRIGKPASFDRFINMAYACIHHNCYEKLSSIQAPTLIIGAEQDVIVTAQASGDIAQQIPGSRLVMYSDYGHGVYEEAKDFNQIVYAFLGE